METGKVKCILTYRYTPFIVFAGVMLILHILIPLGTGDDTWFAGILGEPPTFQSYISYIVNRYATWSSRLLIESMLIALARNPLIWRILDTMMMVWIAYGLSMVFNRRKNAYIDWFIILAVMSFPIVILSEAGWIATTLNYSWPLGCYLITLIPVVHRWEGKQPSIGEYAAVMPALFYACNQEQMAASVFAVSLFLLVKEYTDRRHISRYLLTEIIFALAGMLFILMCPGNAARNISETATWFPDYASFGLFTKVELGFSSTLYQMFYQFDTCFFLLAFTIAVYAFVMSKKLYVRIVAAVPLVAVCILGLLPKLVPSAAVPLAFLLDCMTPSGTNPLSTGSFVPVTVLGLLFLCLLAGVWLSGRKTDEKLFCVYILLLGLATRWIMGFSPTVWASGNRTFFFMYFSFVTVMIMLSSGLEQEGKHKAFICGILPVFAAVDVFILLRLMIAL